MPLKDPVARAAYAKEYAKRNPPAAHLERILEEDRIESAAYRANNADRVKRAKAAYAKRNKDAINAAVARRKAANLQRTPKWLTTDALWMIEQAYELAALRTQMFGFAWHVDHVLPLQGRRVSGLHTPLNLQVIPWVDNLRKGASFHG